MPWQGSYGQRPAARPVRPLPRAAPRGEPPRPRESARRVLAEETAAVLSVLHEASQYLTRECGGGYFYGC